MSFNPVKHEVHQNIQSVPQREQITFPFVIAVSWQEKYVAKWRAKV
jgi:hypothetical protein